MYNPYLQRSSGQKSQPPPDQDRLGRLRALLGRLVPDTDDLLLLLLLLFLMLEEEEDDPELLLTLGLTLLQKSDRQRAAPSG